MRGDEWNESLIEDEFHFIRTTTTTTVVDTDDAWV